VCWFGQRTNHLRYLLFVVASGFLCDPGDSGNCLAVAKSANGDSYEISGAGTFDPKNKSIKAAGTFNHKSTNGIVPETGVWTASELVSFVSYGIAPAALLHAKNALGPPQFGPKHLKMFSGPMPTGGLAVFRILLLPISGALMTAVLQVNCASGDPPRDRSVEGIRLTFEGRRFDPGHVHQPIKARTLRREHYGARYLKGFKTATSKCAKSRSFRVATVRP
jgi:hypothetical protein